MSTDRTQRFAEQLGDRNARKREDAEPRHIGLLPGAAIQLAAGRRDVAG